MKITRKTGTIIAAVVLLAAGIGGFLIGWPAPEKGTIRKFKEAPRISVFMKETGEKKTMPIEDYVAGVVAGEMKPNWPLKAYAAQAILARSFTIEFMSRGGTRAKHGTDISTDQEEAQAYNAGNITPIIRKAVQMTRGEVMTYKDRYVRAWFHSYSGGETASAREGLNFKGDEPPYTKSVKIKENKYAPGEVKHWRVSFPLSKVQEALDKMNVDVGQVRDMTVTERGNTRRAVTLRVVGTRGIQEISAPDFRVALDPMRMKSTLLSKLAIEGNNLVVEGRGFGHGVGLSQWDAYMLAKEGKSPEDIVKFFFRNIEIKKLWK